MELKTNTPKRDGDYTLIYNELLNSPKNTYRVISFLGRGTFGQVVKCWNETKNEYVALKILKNHPNYIKQGRVEIEILTRLSMEDSNTYNLVRAFECFMHRDHTCLVFEMLDQNIYDYIKARHFSSFEMKDIRSIARQVLIALVKLKEVGLIHADLKPENIMLVDVANCGFRVKVIDFGSASYAQKTVTSSYVQSRYYRAPEILLGLPFCESIDMWSLGCVLCELYLGWPIYPGASEYDQLRYIIWTQGMPAEHLLNVSRKVTKFFKKHHVTQSSSYWKLLDSDEYYEMTQVKAKESRKFILNTLDDLSVVARHVDPPRVYSNIEIEMNTRDIKEFIRLVKYLLAIDQNERYSPHQALDSIFINMTHLSEFSNTPTFKNYISAMNLVKRNQPYISNQPRMAIPAPTPQTFHIEQNVPQPVQYYNNNQLKPVELTQYAPQNPIVNQPFVLPTLSNLKNDQMYGSTQMGQIGPPQSDVFQYYNPYIPNFPFGNTQQFRYPNLYNFGNSNPQVMTNPMGEMVNTNVSMNMNLNMNQVRNFNPNVNNPFMQNMFQVGCNNVAPNNAPVAYNFMNVNSVHNIPQARLTMDGNNYQNSAMTLLMTQGLQNPNQANLIPNMNVPMNTFQPPDNNSNIASKKRSNDAKKDNGNGNSRKRTKPSKNMCQGENIQGSSHDYSDQTNSSTFASRSSPRRENARQISNMTHGNIPRNENRAEEFFRKGNFPTSGENDDVEYLGETKSKRKKTSHFRDSEREDLKFDIHSCKTSRSKDVNIAVAHKILPQSNMTHFPPLYSNEFSSSIKQFARDFDHAPSLNFQDEMRKLNMFNNTPMFSKGIYPAVSREVFFEAQPLNTINTKASSTTARNISQNRYASFDENLDSFDCDDVNDVDFKAPSNLCYGNESRVVTRNQKKVS